MREILFRGKILGLTDWSYGYYAKSGENHFILLDTDNEDNYSIVDPETVGQYTGLKDKNGKRIFEGDIVRNNKYGEDNDTYDYYSIIFSNGSFRAQYLDNLEYTPKIYDIYFEGYEVIGNIHDNPELLEVKR